MPGKLRPAVRKNKKKPSSKNRKVNQSDSESDKD